MNAHDTSRDGNTASAPVCSLDLQELLDEATRALEQGRIVAARECVETAYLLHQEPRLEPILAGLRQAETRLMQERVRQQRVQRERVRGQASLCLEATGAENAAVWTGTSPMAATSLLTSETWLFGWPWLGVSGA